MAEKNAIPNLFDTTKALIDFEIASASRAQANLDLLDQCRKENRFTSPEAKNAMKEINEYADMRRASLGKVLSDMETSSET